MERRPALLYLGRDFPVPISTAARLRTYNWIVHLSKHFDVTFVAPVRHVPDESHLDALRPYCVRVCTPAIRGRAIDLRYWLRCAVAAVRYVCTGLPTEAWLLQHGPARDLVQSLQHETRFERVFAERWTWGRDVLAAAPVAVLDAGELLTSRALDALGMPANPLRRWLRGHLARGTARFEAAAVSDAALVLTQDPAQRQAVRALRGDHRAVMLPSGLCTRYFSPRRHEVDPSNVIFFASLGDPERRDALLRLQRDVMPDVRRRLRHAHLTVIGEDPIAELHDTVGADPSLRFTGPLEDERIELWRGAVAALPLRFGSTPRVRLAQLLAMGIPIVTTPHAARSLDLRSGEGLLVAADGPEFAATLVQVLLDSSLREDLSRRGREVAQNRLSIAATYDRLSARLATDDPIV